jgi:hypothetical protein
MWGRRCAALALALSALICGLLAPSALAKKTTFAGPLLGPPAQQPGSMVFFKLSSSGKGRKLRPVAVPKYKVPDLTVSCNDLGFHGGIPFRVAYSTFGVSLPVQNRQFSFTQTFNTGYYGDPGFQTFEIHGRIPRKGPATGTIRYSASWTMGNIGQVTCDSTTSWTARPSNVELPE